mmetsp:Transcript_51388/g.146752  ORF Transcript_51388/g.146752 Transcript_51388/m.146752 type:complete len:304 (-) Transcript_51388:677-1588(-)
MVRKHDDIVLLLHRVGCSSNDLHHPRPVHGVEVDALPSYRTLELGRAALDERLHVHAGGHRLLALLRGRDGLLVDLLHAAQELVQDRIRVLLQLFVETGVRQLQVFLAHVLEREDDCVQGLQGTHPRIGRRIEQEAVDHPLRVAQQLRGSARCLFVRDNAPGGHQVLGALLEVRQPELVALVLPVLLPDGSEQVGDELPGGLARIALLADVEYSICDRMFRMPILLRVDLDNRLDNVGKPGHLYQLWVGLSVQDLPGVGHVLRVPDESLDRGVEKARVAQQALDLLHRQSVQNLPDVLADRLA